MCKRVPSTAKCFAQLITIDLYRIDHIIIIYLRSLAVEGTDHQGEVAGSNPGLLSSKDALQVGVSASQMHSRFRCQPVSAGQMHRSAAVPAGACGTDALQVSVQAGACGTVALRCNGACGTFCTPGLSAGQCLAALVHSVHQCPLFLLHSSTSHQCKLHCVQPGKGVRARLRGANRRTLYRWGSGPP